MFVTVAVVLCALVAKGPIDLDTDCAPQEARVEEIVSDSDKDENLTLISCHIHGQLGVAKWKGEHPIYNSNKWRVARIKCVPGHYEIQGRA